MAKKISLVSRDLAAPEPADRACGDRATAAVALPLAVWVG
jgi:hypothetical protein